MDLSDRPANGYVRPTAGQDQSCVGSVNWLVTALTGKPDVVPISPQLHGSFLDIGPHRDGVGVDGFTPGHRAGQGRQPVSAPPRLSLAPLLRAGCSVRRASGKQARTQLA